VRAIRFKVGRALPKIGEFVTESDLQVYVKARPFLRAIIALIFYIRDRERFPNRTPDPCFVEADSFLTSFEQNRS
jgi:hypothetical protein